MLPQPLQKYFAKRFLGLLTNSPDGVPPWLEVVAAGEDRGLFMPGDAPWVVHASFGTLVGGIRALLVQALHPGTLAGVANHSRYQQDALGRLAGTIRWLTVTTFGSHEAAEAEAGRVNKLHQRVRGEYVDGGGECKQYRAADRDLLLWVHVAFTESFLICHEMYATRPIPGGADAYVAQWACSVEPLGLTECPQTQQELDECIAGYVESGALRVDDATRDVVRFIRNPPLPPTARIVYFLLFRAAVLSLNPAEKALLGLRSGPRWLIQPLTRFVLRAIRFAIGPASPIEDAALARLRRIGAQTD